MTGKPLKEHYEVDSDAGIMVRTFDYISDLEEYCNSVERDLLGKIASIQMLENNFKEYMTSFESHRDELNAKIASLESQLKEKDEEIARLKIEEKEDNHVNKILLAELRKDEIKIKEFQEALKEVYNHGLTPENLDKCRKLIGE